MRRWMLPLLMGTALQAGIMDFQTLSEAKRAYEKGDYAAAAEGYAEVRGKNDAARYDYANALYRQKKYAEAAGIYAKISEPSLRQKALHNLGNSLAMSGKTDEAIKAYEEALTLGDDEETRYNLELLKKQKEQQKKNDRKQNDQDQKKNDQQNDQNQSNQDDQNRSQQNDQQKRKQDQQPNGQNQDKQNQQKDQNGQNSSSQNGDNDQRQGQSQERQEQQEQPREKQQPEEAHSSEASEGRQEQTGSAEDKAQDKKDGEAAQAAVADPISDMEERKYNQMLDKRGIKTLMVPLSGKGEPNEDETTPW